MTKEEILAGLKQAIERGESLEQAKQSFINAGYNTREVEEAAASLGGILTKLQTPTSQTQPNSKQELQQLHTEKPKKPKLKTITIILAILFVILLLILVASLFLKQELIHFLKNLL